MTMHNLSNAALKFAMGAGEAWALEHPTYGDDYLININGQDVVESRLNCTLAEYAHVLGRSTDMWRTAQLKIKRGSRAQHQHDQRMTRLKVSNFLKKFLIAFVGIGCLIMLILGAICVSREEYASCGSRSGALAMLIIACTLIAGALLSPVFGFCLWMMFGKVYK